MKIDVNFKTEEEKQNHREEKRRKKEERDKQRQERALQKKEAKELKQREERAAKEKTKCVYIVLSKTATWPSRVIKLWTRTPYVHTSLALDINLNEMYSFARKRVHNPFVCGFIEEDITKGVFGRDIGTKCLVQRIRITEKQWMMLLEELDKFKKDKEKYHYNFLGIFGVMFNRAVEREYKYFCSQFVYKILQSSGIKMFIKKPGLCKPDDFRQWKKPEVVFEGKLIHYREFVRKYNIKDNVIPSSNIIQEFNTNIHLLEANHGRKINTVDCC